MYIYKFKEVEKAKFTEGLEDFQVCQRVNRETLSTKSTLDKRWHHCTMCTFTSIQLFLSACVQVVILPCRCFHFHCH